MIKYEKPNLELLTKTILGTLNQLPEASKAENTAESIKLITQLVDDGWFNDVTTLSALVILIFQDLNHAFDMIYYAALALDGEFAKKEGKVCDRTWMKESGKSAVVKLHDDLNTLLRASLSAAYQTADDQASGKINSLFH